jgi:hypothetical protein
VQSDLRIIKRLCKKYLFCHDGCPFCLKNNNYSYCPLHGDPKNWDLTKAMRVIRKIRSKKCTSVENVKQK